MENEIQIVDVSLSIRRFFIALLWLSADGCGLHTIETFRPDLRHAELTFSDEFDGDAIDSSKWNAISRILYSNGALNSYNPAMVSVANGHLRLDLQRVPHLGKSYSGGEIDSRGKFSQQYGYFEARIKMPSGSGFHASWWLWPLSDQWPPEIDIVEVKGSEPQTAYMTVHWAENGIVRAYPEQVDFTGDHYAESQFIGHDFSEDFHTFGLEWTPSTLTWYIDGVERHCTNQHVPREPFMLELDLALDSYGGGVNESTSFPASMLVDYVRVYRLPRHSSRGCLRSN